jgi:hypothetical protein
MPQTQSKGIPGVPPEISNEPFKPEEHALTAAYGVDPADEERKRKIAAAELRYARYNARTQPRDPTGRFRQILARLKSNLGQGELEQIQQQINKTDKANDAGNYAKTTEAAASLVDLLQGIKSGVVDDSARNALRKGAADLGRVLAYLPMPKGVDTAKVRFSDLPPSTKKLILDLIQRVQHEVNADDARKINEVLQNFMAGQYTMSADQLGQQLNKLLRFLVPRK